MGPMSSPRDASTALETNGNSQTLATSQVASAGTKRVSLRNGLGLRTDGRNLLWTVGGNAAGTFTLVDGKQISVGSPDAPNVAPIVNDLLRRP
jgi:hypothetical protein